MKPFESFMAPELEEYLAYGLSLGYSDAHLRSLLIAFDRYATGRAHDWDSLTPTFFLQLRKSLKGDPRTVNAILSGARGFFHFLVRRGHCAANPLKDIPAHKENVYIPFVFSAVKIETLLGTIQRRIRNCQTYFLKDLTVYTAIGLMARYGMRISEPLRLRRSHYRRREQTLYIEKTKFNKDRLIPVPEPAAREIKNYLAVREALIARDDNPYLLAGHGQRPLSANRIYPVFYQAVEAIGRARPRRTIANTTFERRPPTVCAIMRSSKLCRVTCAK